MWWCPFIDWLKFETRPSSLLNFGEAYSAVLFAFSVLNSMVLSPAKPTDCKIWILLLEFIDCETGVGKSIPVKVQPPSVK